jgi:uncharacterized protein with GYD domain
MVSEKLTSFKKNIEIEVQIGLKLTDKTNKLTKVIQILNAFGISLNEVDIKEDEYDVIHNKEDCKSSKSVSPSKM